MICYKNFLKGIFFYALFFCINWFFQNMPTLYAQKIWGIDSAQIMKMLVNTGGGYSGTFENMALYSILLLFAFYKIVPERKSYEAVRFQTRKQIFVKSCKDGIKVVISFCCVQLLINFFLLCIFNPVNVNWGLRCMIALLLHTLILIFVYIRLYLLVQINRAIGASGFLPYVYAFAIALAEGICFKVSLCDIWLPCSDLSILEYGWNYKENIVQILVYIIRQSAFTGILYGVTDWFVKRKDIGLGEK